MIDIVGPLSNSIHFVGTLDSGANFDSHLKVYEGTSPHTHPESFDKFRVVRSIELLHSVSGRHIHSS